MEELFVCYDSILDEYNLHTATSVNTPGASTLKADDSVELLSPQAHSRYMRAAKTLQWQSPVRPDINYSANELARYLTEPTTLHAKQIKHLLRYIRGTMH